MADWNNVIRALGCLTDDRYRAVTQQECRESGCPYSGQDCEIAVMEDALKLLKGQEPRVMTLEEAIDAEYVWLEFANKEEVVATMPYLNDAQDTDDIVIFFVPDSMSEYKIVIYPKEDGKYGSTWRCWNKRPTEERRKAVKWK